MGDDDHDSRTIHCGNLAQDKISEEILYELFLQAGPIERVSIPKESDGRNRPYGFVTYKHQVSVPYALSVFSGTKLFNRDLRLNNRSMNKNNNNNNSNDNGNYRARNQGPMEPKPILPNVSSTHQFQMQNPLGNAALRGNNSMAFGQPMNSMNHMMPTNRPQKMEFPQNQQLDYQQLLQLSAQMFAASNGMNLNKNDMGNDDNESHRHQSKMMHRHENRSHNQNSNYSRDRRNDRRRDRSRSRDRGGNNDWIRNRGRDNDRRDRNHGRNDNNRRR